MPTKPMGSTPNAPRNSAVHSTPTGDARFFLTSDLEAAIAQMPEVRGVRIVAAEANIDEIHVMSSKTIKPKTLVRNILTLLLVRFGVRVDHRRISIVQSDAQPDHQLARPVIYQVKRLDAADGQVVSVELRSGGQQVQGTNKVDAQGSEIRSGSLALVHAVEQLLGRQGDLEVREAKSIALADHELIFVLIAWRGALAEELFVGAAFAGNDRAASAARATLDAINRKLVRLPILLST